jgi:hypothetical protein
MDTYDVSSTLDMLKQYYITGSKQMITRWIREGKIKGTRSENRKEGWVIK